MQPPAATPDSSSSRELYIPARFRHLIWSCLDASLPKSAVFYAERYYALNNESHDALHLYASALMRCGQTQSALWLVTKPHQTELGKRPMEPCRGCFIVRAECYTTLGHHAQAGEAFEASLGAPDQTELPSGNLTRETRVFQDEAVLHCKTGKAALKANLPDKAIQSFRRALSLDPLLWDAFEGLCAAGSFPEIEELFPSRPQPTKQGPEEFYANAASSSKHPAASGPVASGSGFFTPAPNDQNTFCGWKPDHAPPQPFRMAMRPVGRDSIATNDSFYPDNSILAPLRTTRAHAAGVPPRPLSSAEETGPVPKKPRSQTRQAAASEKDKSKQGAGADVRSKKARARPVLVSANPISSKPSLPSRNTTSTRGAQSTNTRTGRSENTVMAPPSMASRRSARLLSNNAAGDKQKSHNVKHPPQRKRTAHGRSKSTESEMDEDYAALGDAAHSPSSNTHSPRSDESPVPIWTVEMEQAAQETFCNALADNYIYDLMRLYASCVRYLAMYDCEACLATIDMLPREHQKTVSMLILIARARYEQADYMRAERSFLSARVLDPYRVRDMDLYSTTLWHLQRNAQLSFLAQELLSIDPRSSQAWIAVGNCFSLQKERSQALTCFRRAAQLDSSCAYAYTLSGHELTDEDLDKAVNFFQSALRADQRSYNAWYGLGSCYLRMSKLRLAEYHFRKAAAIHPQNAVLLGCVGMAVERRGDQDAAFALFNEAVRLSPDNALVRYRRAKILIAMKRYREAIEDLEYLRDSSPEEANVVFQLARVYRLVGEETKFAQMLAIARDMSPKSLNKIKRLLATEKDGAGGDSMDEG
ncbi:TPR-like protein [Phellopilus nigrolimitatus]|nr:TPR-like protein [Phellopilus nigrolimitatus]